MSVANKFFALPVMPSSGTLTIKLPGTAASELEIGIPGTTQVLVSTTIPVHARVLTTLISSLVNSNPNASAEVDLLNAPGPAANDSAYAVYNSIQQILDTPGTRSVVFDRAIVGQPLALNSNQELGATGNTKGMLMPYYPANTYPSHLITNKNQTFDPAAIIDHNLIISNGIYNARDGAVYSKDGGWPGVLKLAGVIDLLVDGGTFQGGVSFTFHLFNLLRAIFRNGAIICGPQPHGDGMHFNGPHDTVLIENWTFTGQTDDRLAFNGSQDPIIHDLAYALGLPDSAITLYDGFNQFGGQKNFTVRNIHFDGGRWGQRMLGEGYVLENFYCSNYYGWTNDYWLIADNYTGNNQAAIAYIKNCHWDDIRVETLDDGGSELKRRASLIVQCSTDTISFTNVRRLDFTAAWCTFLFQGFNHTTIDCSNYVAHEAAGTAFSFPHFRMEGFYYSVPQSIFHADTLLFKNAIHTRVDAAIAGSSFLHFDYMGTIGTLDLTGSSCQNIQHVVHLRFCSVDTLILTNVTRTGNDPAEKLVYMEGDSHITSLVCIGFTGTLADLVCGPAAANVTNLVVV